MGRPLTQAVARSPRTHVPAGPTSRNHGLDTVPIEDPELQEALRQLQAGEHMPDKTTGVVIGTPNNGENDTPIREVRRRAVYTREQKLAAVHYASNTYRTTSNGSRRLISGPEAAQLLNVSWTVLGQWIKDADKIQSI